MYNPYMQNYNQQTFNDRIDGEIAKLQQMKNNVNQTPAINQTFQLAPANSHTMKYANTIEDVIRENVYFDTPFFSKDMSVMWIKTVKGEIKTYELSEIVPKDAKDMQIELLQAQINELKGKIEHESNNANVTTKQNETTTTTDDGETGTTAKESEPTSISRVSTSKKK